MGFKKRDIVMFFAGLEAYHTISHIIYAFVLSFPFKAKGLTLSVTLNTWMIVINGILTIGLLWWGQRLSKRNS